MKDDINNLLDKYKNELNNIKAKEIETLKDFDITLSSDILVDKTWFSTKKWLLQDIIRDLEKILNKEV